MHIALIEIENFRGIREMTWAPSSGVNCLIGPGDSTKTTVLDAIELCLNPRAYFAADDCDFFNLDHTKPVRIIITLAGLPAEFTSEFGYGQCLRGWKASTQTLEDEPREGLEYALSLLVEIDGSLETNWSIFNDRIAQQLKEKKDPPTVRRKDAKLFATTRLGPYAERHLGWGRTSVLTRLEEAGGSLSAQLAEASRAARKAFQTSEQAVFKKAVERAQLLSKTFSVPVRGNYTAELDVEGVSITSGGISLHDDHLPLRRLGSGSTRLIVSALQHDTGSSHIALIDEIEHGLEPHRLARLLRFLKTPKKEAKGQTQIFVTTHSPVVITELTAGDIHAVRSSNGQTTVKSIARTAKDLDTAQRHMRKTPEAFLARRIIVGEGRTEHGVLRGLDAWWTANGRESFALQGAIAVDGGGGNAALIIGEHLIDLGYEVFVLLDSDQAASLDHEAIKRIRQKRGTVTLWADTCSTEMRVVLDLPWKVVAEAVRDARDPAINDDSALARLNNVFTATGLAAVVDLSLPSSLDSEAARRAVGTTAHQAGWYKSIAGGERLAAIIGPHLDEIASTPLAQTLSAIRTWVDA